MAQSMARTVDVRVKRVSAVADKAPEYRFRVADYAVILKPNVMSLVVFTALVGLFLAPGTIDALSAVIAIVCIALGAGGAGAVNMWYDRDIDLTMSRTRARPIPAGRMNPRAALVFGSVLATASVGVMAVFVNVVAAVLLAVTFVYYVFIYTVWLKRRTPHNIVIGGASGALPPVIGWAAVSGGVDLGALALFAIIFLWTPPHSWALALFRRDDYARARVPMLPVAAGERATRNQILVYSLLLIPATLVPVAIGLSGALYGVGASILGVMFMRHALRVWRDTTDASARPMFGFSIVYLFAIFVFLLADSAIPLS
ncbi:MAG: protoheme IX farnesyltransferase [Rhodospirillales bacterium]|nr:protoheme IX farnesyltransferase [Rhodospirillales bacterium]